MRTKTSKVKPEGNSLSEKMVMYGLLLREEFRQMLLHTEVGCDYFIDDDTYVEIPESVGCFRTGTKWTVYETDERGAAILKMKHDNPAEAFRDAASRRKLSFTPGEAAQSVLHDSLSREQLSKQLRNIRLAIQNLKKVDELMCLTENPDAVKEDIRVLKNIEKQLDTSLKSAKSTEKAVETAFSIEYEWVPSSSDAGSIFRLRYPQAQMYLSMAENAPSWAANDSIDMNAQNVDNSLKQFYPLPKQEKKQLAFALEE